VVNRAIRHILSTQQDNGLYRSPDNSHGPMYEHALAALAMIESYAFLPSDEIRQSVQKAIDLIVKSQNPQGGWRYQPTPTDADLSVTVMQIVALRAAMNARLDVPEQTVAKAIKYVKACAVDGGGYAYRPGGGPGEARTAAGLLSMELLGAFDDPSVEAGFEWMAKRRYHQNTSYFWYMNYYAMQAHFQAGGSRWASWHPQVRRFLLENQNPDGSWEGYKEQKHNGNEAKCYSTGLAALTLEVYMHYLPAYQR
jgi:prenyltransferase beta subunit